VLHTYTLFCVAYIHFILCNILTLYIVLHTYPSFCVTYLHFSLCYIHTLHFVLHTYTHFILCYILTLQFVLHTYTSFCVKVTLQRMASAFSSVCSYARTRSQTLIYVRGTLGIPRIRSEYDDIRRCSFVIRRDQINFKDFISVCQHIKYTLLSR